MKAASHENEESQVAQLQPTKTFQTTTLYDDVYMTRAIPQLHPTMNKIPDDHIGTTKHELEIIKAVAQAWLGHSNFPNPASEFETRIAKFKTRPSRFKTEAATRRRGGGGGGIGGWDFNKSLWDPYEIVAVSKKLEDGMVVLDREFLDPYCPRNSPKRRRESKNSLRSLFGHLSLTRFD